MGKRKTSQGMSKQDAQMETLREWMTVWKAHAEKTAGLDLYTDLYSECCDAVERAWQHWPVDSHKEDPYRHTSDYARAAANRIMDVVHEYMRTLGTDAALRLYAACTAAALAANDAVRNTPRPRAAVLPERPQEPQSSVGRERKGGRVARGRQ